jgi:hypothetical protein
MVPEQRDTFFGSKSAVDPVRLCTFVHIIALSFVPGLHCVSPSAFPQVKLYFPPDESVSRQRFPQIRRLLGHPILVIAENMYGLLAHESVPVNISPRFAEAAAIVHLNDFAQRLIQALRSRY